MTNVNGKKPFNFLLIYLIVDGVALLVILSPENWKARKLVPKLTLYLSHDFLATP